MDVKVIWKFVNLSELLKIIPCPQNSFYISQCCFIVLNTSVLGLQCSNLALLLLFECLVFFFFSSTAEITMFENSIVVYKFVQDLHFFVTGGEDENELILATVLQGFFDAVGLLLRYLSRVLANTSKLIIEVQMLMLLISEPLLSNLAWPFFQGQCGQEGGAGELGFNSFMP